MRYLGLDVHVGASVWCLLDAEGTVVERGKTPTTAPELESLLGRLSEPDELLVGQEVGKMSYFVHDVATAAGVKILSFNAHHLRMIASSRKKTDKRDAYWIAKALQTGMTPHPVYIPTGEIRELRSLLSQREAIVTERTRWLARARAHLQAAGYKPRPSRTVQRLIESATANPDGIDAHLGEALELCKRTHSAASLELKRIEVTLHQRARSIDAVQRLQTIPAVGERVALMIHAWVGDVSRFRNARELASYAGLVPSVWQSASAPRTGGITKQGTPQLRRVLVQAAHVLLWRCQSDESAPLKAIAERIHTARVRRKIAVVAGARHILKIAYYVLRDGTSYDPKLLRSVAKGNATQSPAA